MNLAHILAESLARHPERIAFAGDERALSYAQLARLSENLAASLAGLGLADGARLAIVLPNIPEYALAVFAAWRLGAEPVLVNPQLTGSELLYILKDSQSVAVIAPTALAPVFTPLRSELPDVRFLWIGAGVPEGELDLMALALTPGNFPIAERGTDDIAQVMYTSGTTGQPKGALLTHGNLLANARSGIELLSVTAEDHLFCILPVFHAFAFTAALIILPMAGGKVTFEYRYQPKKILAQLSDPTLTVMVAVPSLLATLLRFPEAFRLPAGMRVILCGGGALPPQLEQEFAGRFGDLVRQGYGMTECSPYAAVSPPEQPAKYGSIGKVMPQGHEMAVRDPASGAFLANGEVGELVVRGPHVFKGYWNRPEASAEVFVEGGWLRTGDLGYRDEDGYFFIVDRLKDMLIVGGEKVYSREVEDALMGFGPIREVAVVGDPDPDKGDLVHAYVSLREGQEATAEQVIAHARGLLAAYKVPKRVTILPELPKSATGKILKRELRRKPVAV